MLRMLITLPSLIPVEVVYGNIWTPVGKINDDIDFIFKTLNGNILIGSHTSGGTFNIHRSTDNMLTWFKVFEATRSVRTEHCIIQATDTNIYIVFTNWEIYKSNNDGETFTLYSTIPAHAVVSFLLDLGGGLFQAIMNRGDYVFVMKSPNYGITWENLKVYGYGLNYWWSDVIKISDGIVAAKCDTWNPVKFAKSFNSDPNTFLEGADSFAQEGPNGNIYLGNKKLSTGYMIAIGADKQVFRSTDSGVSWSLLAGTPPTTTVYCIYVKKNTVFVGMNLKVMKSVDGGLTFLDVTSGVLTGECKVISEGNDNVLLIGTKNGTNNLYRSTS